MSIGIRPIDPLTTPLPKDHSSMESRQIVKRDGRIESWSTPRIGDAIFKAFKASGIKDRMMADRLAKKVADKVFEDGRVMVEQEFVQDTVESILMKSGFDEVARRYIIYREQRRAIRSMDTTYMLDSKEIIDSYLDESDWRVNENANIGMSVSGLILHMQGEMQKKYVLNSVYTKEIREAHMNGYFHIHDLSFSLVAYCSGWSFRDLLLDGFSIKNACAAGPANHFTAALGQCVNFLGTLQNEWAGAQALNNFDTYLAPFIRHDGLDYEQTKQAIQNFIHSINTTSRWGGQCPFTNVTIDVTCPEHMKNEPVIIGGKYQESTYGEYQTEMNMFNNAFVEILMKGDNNGSIFSYPIPTYNVTKDFPWESEVVTNVLGMTAKYGIPYFQNFINSDLDPKDIRSMCPLTGDTKVLVRSTRNFTQTADIKTIYERSVKNNLVYEVWTPEGWSFARPVKMPMTDVYEITLSNGSTIKMGENHLQPVRGINQLEILSAKDLKMDMWIPYNKDVIPNYGLGNYSLGYAVGAYLGDGSLTSKGILYSLNQTTKLKTAYELAEIWAFFGFSSKLIPSTDGELLTLRINGRPWDLISDYVGGDGAITKYISDAVFDTTEEFKFGLIDGLMDTDGSREKKRLYTSSLELVNTLKTLFTQLGKKCRLCSVDTRDGRLGTAPNYCLSFTDRTSYGNMFNEDSEYNYYSIVKIENLGKLNNEELYCFEVANADNLFMLADGMITHNCRLSLNLNEIRKKTGGLFGAGDLTGSVGVTTLNLSKLAYLAQDENEFMDLITEYADLAKESLEIKRKFVNKQLESGQMPWTKKYLKNGYGGHFSTIGINAGHEACMNLIGKGIETKEGTELMVRVLQHLNILTKQYQEETGNLYNLEAAPAEGVSYRLAKLDRELYGKNIYISGNEETPYYTNSTNLPVNHTSDVFEALEHQDKLQPLYSGGTVFHSFFGEAMPDVESVKNFLIKAMSMTKIPYISITPTFSICPEHKYISGEHFECPKCGCETSVYSRIVGYFRSISRWNVGKKQEFKERKTYDIDYTELNSEMKNSTVNEKLEV